MMDLYTDNESPLYSYELYEPLQLVQHYLRLKDLHHLSCVSRRFNVFVEAYCQRRYARLAKETDIKEIFDRLLLNYDEIAFQTKINQKQCSYKYLYFVYMSLRHIRRFPIAQCYVCFLGDDRYIIKEFDDVLNRELVHLKSLCWLDITHTFKQVDPGKYIAATRINIPNGSVPVFVKNGYCLHTQWVDSEGSHETSTDVDPDRFKSILGNFNFRQEDSSEYSSNVSNYETTGYWFDFTIEPFTLTSKCDVKFGVPDCIGKWLLWDYIELKLVDEL